MFILVVLAHPDSNSFNHAIAEKIRDTLTKNGHSIGFIDLYNENFDPLLPKSEISRNAVLDNIIREHCKNLSIADGIVIIHPNWWGMPPAILTGWIDRVFRPGLAYRFLEGDKGDGVPEALLKIQTAIVINTANTPEEREMKVFGDPLERIWRDCIFGLCGNANFIRKIFRVIITSTADQRQIWLDETRDMVDQFFPSREGQI